MKKPLFAGVLNLTLVFLLIAGCNGGDDDETAGEVEVPIDFEGASNVGSIGIELTYDSTVLEVTDVKSGELAGNAMMEYNIDSPGLVIIGIVDSSGINGDGAVATVSFNQVGDGRTSPLNLENVETHDATTLVDIINETSDGSFATDGNTVTVPVVRFAD